MIAFMDALEANQFKCPICGGTNFTNNEGFYYCVECGTQTNHIQDVQFDEVAYDATRPTYTSKLKIKKTELAASVVELTTWECFNYLLHGMVEELISLGAKDELKLVTLQLWAAYLRKNEAAFFNAKYIQLPKLGPCHSPRDAKIIYNHGLAVKRRAKKVSVSRGRGAWQRQKNKLAEAEYEAYSQSQSEANKSGCSSSFSKLTSSTGTTGRPARLTFTNLARKHYKKVMSTKHLEKHEIDDNKDLDCHVLHGNKSSLCRSVRVIQLSRLTACTILYIALNLTQDDIQLSDMLKFMHQGHLSSKKISHYFPDNIAEDCVKTINKREFTSSRNIFLDISVRKHAVNICRFIYIPDLKLPNLSKLVLRYCKDFCLPIDLALYAERLINLSPPEMKFRFEFITTPCYEGRAMAYIIFLLKLLFGLDDNKENKMSDSAKILNIELRNLKLPELFVWSDWVEYIEMRKIVLAQYNVLINDHKNNTQLINDKYIEDLINENIYTDDDIMKLKRKKVQNMKTIFEQFLLNTDQSSGLPPIECRPTLTPEYDYMTEILKQDQLNNTQLPALLRIDHSTTNVHAFVNGHNLVKHLKSHSIKLNIVKLECRNIRNYYKIFRKCDNLPGKNYRDVRVRRAKLDISESQWLENVQTKIPTEDFMVPDRDRVPHLKPEKAEKQLMGNGSQEKGDEEITNDYIYADLSDDNCSEFDDTNVDTDLELLASSLDYWTLFGKLKKLTETQFCEIKNKFPTNFLWLMENMSKYLGIDMSILYEELIIIENQFMYVLENMENMKDILVFKSTKYDEDLARVIDHYKMRW